MEDSNNGGGRQTRKNICCGWNHSNNMVEEDEPGRLCVAGRRTTATWMESFQQNACCFGMIPPFL